MEYGKKIMTKKSHISNTSTKQEESERESSFPVMTSAILECMMDRDFHSLFNPVGFLVLEGKCWPLYSLCDFADLQAFV